LAFCGAADDDLVDPCVKEPLPR